MATCPGVNPGWNARTLGSNGKVLFKLGAAGHEHHHRDLKFGGVLLKVQVAVSGQENIEFRLRQREVLADDHRSILPGQCAAQTPVEAFVNERERACRQTRACRP